MNKSPRMSAPATGGLKIKEEVQTIKKDRKVWEESLPYLKALPLCPILSNNKMASTLIQFLQGSHTKYI